MCVVLAISDASVERTLAINNYFFHPDSGELVVYVMDQVTAWGWMWPLVTAFFLWIPAWELFKRRNARQRSPRPVRYACLLTAWWFAARLALEKTAAPAGLTEALGVTFPTVLILPFFGGWASTRGMSFGRFVVALLSLALVQRLLVTSWSLAATSFGLGTHLDMSAIEQITMPVLGTHDFRGGDHAVAQWFWTVATPQLTVWILQTMIAGLVLCTPAFMLARRTNYANFSTNIRR